MRQIKDLGIKSKEGLKVKNLKRFPSMEYGPMGGLQAELWLGNHTYLGTLYQEGNGGCANFTWNANLLEKTKKGIKGLIHSFLLRNDKNYGPNSKYSWLKNKTAENVDDDDIEMLVICFEEAYDARKFAEKQFKKGYKTVARLNRGYCFNWLSYRCDNVTIEEINKYILDNSINCESIDLFTHNQDLAMI